MTISPDTLRPLLKQFKFVQLFNELGWDHLSVTHPLHFPGASFMLTGVAEKKGVQIYVCSPDPNGKIPDYAMRRKIDQELPKLAFEHLLIFADAKKTMQVWQWLAREPGKTTALRQETYYASQTGDALLQKLKHITFPLSEEETLSLTLVTTRLKDAFDRDKVTKRFFDRFKDEHKAFLDFIANIPDVGDQAWYASVMINRLMFLYFIQGKGFLNGSHTYLVEKLASSPSRLGRAGVGSYYKDFLCPLFFDGLAKRESERDDATKKLLGQIPYLNGGIFAKHQIESDENYGDLIAIPDAAFARLFQFFGEFDWTLDTRPIANGKEINPDVLGYIFEKYVNQKQMGAYYTKEDITEYIGKNTIVPFLFDRAHAECRVAFDGEHTIWHSLQVDPDRYIYPAVKHGVEHPLPPNIEAGVAEVANRGDWNRPAPDTHALSTEIWREVVARRQRYQDVHDKLASGAIHEINDFITYNLNIRQFALDTLTGWDGPDLLRAFWDAVKSITVLDPTCGSGAFLFAALEILKPLYEACLDRMAGFVADADQLARPHDHPKFRATLDDVAKHPNRDYFVLKSIIVNNLYGVDIMEEATEICKLRLFLKLAAQVEPDPKKDNFGVEPLPDIDFNIRAGNTLVGYATEKQVQEIIDGKDQQSFDLDSKWPAFKRRLDSVQHKFEMFQGLQTAMNVPTGLLTQAKSELKTELKSLGDELDTHSAILHGAIGKTKFDAWKKSAQPFHWFVEYYNIFNSKKGGGRWDSMLSSVIRLMWITRK